MQALPTYELAREKAAQNDAKIRALVEDNAKHAKSMEESSQKIIDWAKRLEPRKQAVVNQ